MRRSTFGIAATACVLVLLSDSGAAAAESEMLGVSGGIGMVPPIGPVEASFVMANLEFALGTKVTIGPVMASGSYMREVPEDDKDDGSLFMVGAVVRFYPWRVFKGFYIGGTAQIVVVDYTDYDWNTGTNSWDLDQDYTESLAGPGFICGGKIPVAPHVFIDPSFMFGLLVNDYTGNIEPFGSLNLSVGGSF